MVDHVFLGGKFGAIHFFKNSTGHYHVFIHMCFFNSSRLTVEHYLDLFTRNSYLIRILFLIGNGEKKCLPLDSISVIVSPLSSASVSGALEIEHYLAARVSEPNQNWVVLVILFLFCLTFY